MKRSGNKLIKLSLLGLLVGTSGVWEGCTSKFDEINTSKTAITTLGPTELPYLFSRAQQQASYAAGTYQTAQNLFADLYAQYFATTTPNFQSDRYFMHRTWINNHWNPIYTQVVPQLKTLFDKTDPNSSQYALANIWWVFSFHRLTDYYGPVPYFDAGTPANSVKYDAQDKIYDDFFKRLAAATTVLKGKTSEKPYGTYDIIYSGDVTKWIKFANTLRLRLAMRISKVDPTRAKTEAEAAIAGGLLTDVGDNAVMTKTLADNNGLATISGWGEFRMSAAMESVLKGFEDPRIGIYFQPAFSTKTYEGLRNGLGSAELTDPLNTNDNNSNIGDRWIKNTGAGSAWDRQLGFRQDIMHTAEAYFLMAEAALNGWNVGSNGTAQQLYEKGIKASMEGWGITGSVVDTYVASTKTPIAPQDQQKSPALSTITVKWGATDAIQREQIGTQKWLALYPDGMEAWAEARRTRFPKRYPVVNSVNTDLPTTSYPRRIPFLLLEEQSNTEAVKAAVSLLGGPDNAATPLWWDKN